MIGSASALPSAFHTDFGILVESGGALFLDVEREVDQASGTYTSVMDLQDPIEHYLPTYNANSRPFRGYRKAEDILASVGRAAKALSRKIGVLFVKHHTSNWVGLICADVEANPVRPWSTEINKVIPPMGRR